MPVRISNRFIYDQTMTVMAEDSFSFLASVSSSPHVMWVIQRGVTLGSGPRYTPSDVFETFPRPPQTDWTGRAGQMFHVERSAIMAQRNLGLTKLYNIINDPEIGHGSDVDVASLREIHLEVDRAVMDAYGS